MRMKIYHRILLAIVLIVGGLLPAGAQMVNAPIPTQRIPDVQVIAFPLPTHEWAVTTVYPKVVSQADAQGRVNRLLALTGWKANGMEFKNKALERAASDTPKAAVMSSVTFRTTGGVVDLVDGTMPLVPFARAFRDLQRVHITYIIPGKTFTFRGIRQFSDNNLDLSLSQGQGAYTYVLNIKNHNLDALQLPRYETLKEGQGTQTAAGGAVSHPSLPTVWVGTGLAVLLAFGAGAMAYLLFARLATR